MKINVLNERTSVANRYLAELRDVHIQQDRPRFRNNVQRLGNLMAYEFSKSLTAQTVNITTPLEKITVPVPDEDLVLVTIMRAGIPFFQGFLDVFDGATSGFIGAYREEGGSTADGGEIAVTLNYSSVPNLHGKQLVLIDPMLATGKSLIKAFQQCQRYGMPRSVHFMSIISAPEGLAYVQQNVEHPGSLWTWARDSHLNDRAYIVPGLGDAGDLSFGRKE